MRCPKCGSRDDKVIDSRQSRDSSSIRRRRQCLSCGYRFTTYEEIERSDLRVIKRDRRTHEQFDRRKLAGSIAKAFEKRSTSLLTLDEFVDAIQKLGRRVKKNSAQRELFAVDETQEPRLKAAPSRPVDGGKTNKK